jgi:acyl-coenzyme A thioesterase PaaI-like protein
MPITITAKAIKVGRTLAQTRTEIHDKNGNTIAIGLHTKCNTVTSKL